jgi:hypothetical protein
VGVAGLVSCEISSLAFFGGMLVTISIVLTSCIASSSLPYLINCELFMRRLCTLWDADRVLSPTRPALAVMLPVPLVDT